MSHEPSRRGARKSGYKRRIPGVNQSAVTAVLESVLTCPACGKARTETMPTDACMFFWVCPDCGTRHKPKPGDCCVFCSYGSMPCPPVQASRPCG